jgi:hypothetical protein
LFSFSGLFPILSLKLLYGFYVLSEKYSAALCRPPRSKPLRLELIRAGIVARDGQAPYDVGPPVSPLHS